MPRIKKQKINNEKSAKEIENIIGDIIDTSVKSKKIIINNPKKKSTGGNLVQKNLIIKEKLLVVDQIIDLYPALKKDRQIIVDVVLGNIQPVQKIEIWEKIQIDKKYYYKDKSGILIDNEINCVGFETEPGKYLLFEKQIAMTNKLKDIMQRLQ